MITHLGRRCQWAPLTFCTLLVLLAGLLVAGGAVAAEPVAYVVGPNDVLVVAVFNQPQLSGKYVVEADGTVTFPLLGRVRVGGLDLRSVEDVLRGGLGKGYLKTPQVTVSVDQYRSQQVFVTGEVRQPGGVPLTGSMTLIEALARAGSTTERAGQEAVIVRGAAGSGQSASPDAADPAQRPAGAEVIRISLQTLPSNVEAQKLALRPGDTIFVPPAETLFVMGQVKAAGEYSIRRNMTVRQAVALARGITDRGSARRIQIVRQVNGKEVTYDAQLSDPVQPGDTVVVRERLF